VSDDGRHALTVIAFVGSVFSPYYAWSRRFGAVDPVQHCAVNVALYGASGQRWSMTERGRAAVHRSPERLVVGPSRLEWRNDALELHLEEVAVPLPRRVRGTVRVVPLTRPDFVQALDAAGQHCWSPIAPAAHVEAHFEHPALTWQGRGYLDANAGTAALESAFRTWHWSRAHGTGGSTEVNYDVQRRDGTTLGLGLRIAADGSVAQVEQPPLQRLPPTLWRIDRRARTADHRAPTAETLEDTPFYARTLLRDGPREVVHETLSLDRFRSPWVQAMLPFRMPRRSSGGLR
jgi:carotenoid 1,2-hydratase